MLLKMFHIYHVSNQLSTTDKEFFDIHMSTFCDKSIKQKLTDLKKIKLTDTLNVD